MQYLDLVRDCIAVFSLCPLPPNDIQTAHTFSNSFDASYTYETNDIKQHRDHQKTGHPYSAERHEQSKEAAKKRKDKKKQERLELDAEAQRTLSSSLVVTGSVSQEMRAVEREERTGQLIISNRQSSSAEMLLLKDTPEHSEIAAFIQDAQEARASNDPVMIHRQLTTVRDIEPQEMLLDGGIEDHTGPD